MRTRTTALSAVCFTILLILSACGSGNVAGSNRGSGEPLGSAIPSANGESPQQETTTASGGKTTLVFATFFPDERYQEAKQKYEALHPEVEIKLEDVQTDDSHLEAAMEKFQTTMNTSMLAGKGPDLLQMDDLQVDLYVKHHLLEDLNNLMEQDPAFDKNDYFTNVLDNAQIGGGLYSMPLSFFLEGLAGDQDAITQAGVQIDDESWSWNDFAQTADKLVNKTYPNVISAVPENMLSWMVSDNYALFVDRASGQAHFDSASFTALMKQIKTMSEDGVIGMKGQPYFFPIQINSPGDYFESLKGFRASNMQLYVKPHAEDAGAGGYFQAYRSVGLNANSKVKDQAWDFIKFMMSDQISVSPYHAGFPINKKLYDQEVAELKQKGTVPTAQEGPLHGVPVKVDNAQLEGLKKYVTGAVHPVPRFGQNTKIEDMIVEESKAFFSGQKSAEEVAKLIQNKAATYLNE